MPSSPTLGDVIRAFGATLRERRAGAVTPAQTAVLGTLERCHTAALGGHVYQCDSCGSEQTAFNSCGNRHCPSCLAHKSAQWLQARHKELLPVPYFHVVFTLPEQISALALGNKKVVLSILFRAAAATLLTLAADPKHLGANIGFLAILHTWTQTLLFHPHIHCVVPGGGLSSDGTRWVASRRHFFLPVRVLSRLFRGKFLDLLGAARDKSQLHFAGVTAGLSDDPGWRTFVRQMRAKEWVVYAKSPFGSPEQVLKYLARYTHRVAISNSRILGIEGDQVRFRYRDRTDGTKTRVMSLGGVEFLRRFLLHVLPAGFVRIRYFGFLAPRCRTALLTQCRSLLVNSTLAAAILPQPPAKPDSAANSHDLCPVCRTGHLRLVATLLPTRQLLTSQAVPPRDTS